MWAPPTPVTFLEKGQSKTFKKGCIGKGGVDQKLLKKECQPKASPFGRGGGAADGEGEANRNRLLPKEYRPKRTPTETPQHEKCALCQR